MKTATRLVGATVSNARKENDFYPTPVWAVDALLEYENFTGEVWEPACGDGAISKTLMMWGYKVFSSDIVDRGFPFTELDFLASENISDNIITNPPFNLCTEFIDKAKTSSRNKIAMFLKTTALEGNKRYKMWVDKEFPLATMYQFVDRVSFGKDNGEKKAGGMMAFAWFVWDKKHVGPPIIKWLK